LERAEHQVQAHHPRRERQHQAAERRIAGARPPTREGVAEGGAEGQRGQEAERAHGTRR
jgi:hypothetical protein